jgi:hypothetical protein
MDWDIPKLNLFKDSKLPQVQKIIEEITDFIFRNFHTLTKPAFYFYLIIILFFTFKNYRLILIPTILNTFILIFISPSNDWCFVQ